MAGAASQTGSFGVRRAAHALGNVFLGVALGLGVYYGLTDLVTRSAQSDLRETLGPASVATPEVVPASTAFDWVGWKAEDDVYWRNLAEGGAFGRLVIAKIGLDTTVVKGAERKDLKRGPGWIDYTSFPGPTGNTGIAGHRTTYGHPFRFLDRLSPGDTIDLYSPARRYRYRVAELLRVTPDQVEVMRDTGSPQLTLSACDPPYSARYRLIVRAELVEVKRLATTESGPDGS